MSRDGKAVTCTVSATQARVHFGDLLRRVVEEQTPVVVERGAKPQVVVLSIEEYERLRHGRSERRNWRELLRRTHEQILAEGGGRLTPPSEEVIRQMREERDAQLSEMR